jgi:uncharacterized protein
MYRYLGSLVILFSLFASSCVYAGLDDAKAAYKIGDYITALKEFRALAEQGNAEAQNRLGDMYANGQGLPSDYVQAAKWYRKAAEQGYAPAQCSLGTLYEEGLGVPKDNTESAKWYRVAGAECTEIRQFVEKLVKTPIVPADDTEAVEWYRREAEQGNAAAQYILGERYYFGKGVPQDYAQAAKWLRSASEQGYAKAQSSLGTMYLEGQGVSQDYVLAHMWFNLAAAQGEALTAISRDNVAMKMTPSQIQEAQRLAREWKAKPNH